MRELEFLLNQFPVNLSCILLRFVDLRRSVLRNFEIWAAFLRYYYYQPRRMFDQFAGNMLSAVDLTPLDPTPSEGNDKLQL